jgi:hypothetical protein
MEMPVDVLRRFMTKFHREGECWVWHASKNNDGYGSFAWSHKKTTRAHRVSYEHFREAIPEGMVTDHLCRNRACVNPLHLEIVTAKENTMRGQSPVAKNAGKTSCKHGHPFSEENTYRIGGERACIACRDVAAKKYHKKAYVPHARTHCKRGHEYTPENTKPRRGNPKVRACITCAKELHKKRLVGHRKEKG